MYKAKHHQLPQAIQKLFQIRENKHNLRGICMFKKQHVRTNTKTHCISVKGVNLWNSCGEDLKTCKTLSKLKQIFTNNIRNGYKMEMDT